MDKVTVMSLSEQIYNILKDDIVSQRIPCGSWLTLKSLQDRFDTSSTPVREAITKLVQEGLVSHKTNVGATVIELDENDARELFELQIELDCAAMRFAFASPEKTALDKELGTIIEHEKHFLKTEDLEESEYWSNTFHRTFFKYCSNDRLVRASDMNQNQIAILTKMYHNDIKSYEFLTDGHEHIYKAFASGNFEKACDIMREHLASSQQASINRLRARSETAK